VVASHTEVEAQFLAGALRPEARVLDAGCGRTTRLAGYRDRIAELVGVDVDAEAGAENLALDRFVVADLCSRLPFEDAYFDLVYANFVVEHLDAPEAAFRRASFIPVRVGYVGTLHRYAERKPRLPGLIRALERLFPPPLRSTIIAWYRPA
jgi:SAM-dependent methyltransferase